MYAVKTALYLTCSQSTCNVLMWVIICCGPCVVCCLVKPWDMLALFPQDVVLISCRCGRAAPSLPWYNLSFYVLGARSPPIFSQFVITISSKTCVFITFAPYHPCRPHPLAAARTYCWAPVSEVFRNHFERSTLPA